MSSACDIQTTGHCCAKWAPVTRTIQLWFQHKHVCPIAKLCTMTRHASQNLLWNTMNQREMKQLATRAMFWAFDHLPFWWAVPTKMGHNCWTAFCAMQISHYAKNSPMYSVAASMAFDLWHKIIRWWDCSQGLFSFCSFAMNCQTKLIFTYWRNLVTNTMLLKFTILRWIPPSNIGA